MKKILGIVLFLTTLSTYSQEVNNIIYPSIGFEHPQHLDVYVSVVNCDGLPSLLITTFNENPNRKDITTSFKITIKDNKNGSFEDFYFPKKTYKFGKMKIFNCENLSYMAKSTLDWTSNNSTKEIILSFDYEK